MAHSAHKNRRIAGVAESAGADTATPPAFPSAGVWARGLLSQARGLRLHCGVALALHPGNLQDELRSTEWSLWNRLETLENQLLRLIRVHHQALCRWLQPQILLFLKHSF